MFSRRSGLPRTKSPLARAIEQAHGAGNKPLLDLTVSNPTHAQLPVVADVLSALTHPASLHYRPEPFGSLAAREAVAAFLAERGQAVEPERVVLTASTSEAYAFLFKLLCDPGDLVLAPAPSYPLVEHLASFEGVGVGRYLLRYDGRWHIARETLPARAPRRARAVLVVDPNNPTGNYLTPEDLCALDRLNLPLISDQVFSPYRLEGSAADAYVGRDGLTFRLQGLSKLALLPQMKLSFVCIDGPKSEVREALARLELIADAFLSVATPIQLALPAILRAQPAIERSVVERLRCNRELLVEVLADTACSPLHVEGGWYAVVRLPALRDDEAWALSLLHDAGVIVQPGYLYDFPEGPYVVLSLLTPSSRFAEGVGRIRQTVMQAAGG